MQRWFEDEPWMFLVYIVQGCVKHVRHVTPSTRADKSGSALSSRLDFLYSVLTEINLARTSRASGFYIRRRRDERERGRVEENVWPLSMCSLESEMWFKYVRKKWGGWGEMEKWDAKAGSKLKLDGDRRGYSCTRYRAFLAARKL